MTLAVSIDLDPLDCYAAIHGLRGGAGSAAARRYVMDRCVPPALELLGSLGIAATFFVVGRELAGGDGVLARKRLDEITRAGHEVGSHSYAHDYAMARRPPHDIAEDLARADGELGAATGQAVRGFRAPGYDLSPALARCIAARGYLYDSSLLPAPAYWVAKAAVMATMRLRGRSSSAVLTEPRALWAPRAPFVPRLDAPWRAASPIGDHSGSGSTAAAAPYWQLPIMVTPRARVPVIGTSVAMAPAPLRHRATAWLARVPLVHLEFHGIDWADAADPEIEFLKGVQPDVRRTRRSKAQAFAELLTPLTQARASATLATYVATRLGAPAHRSAH